MGEQLVGTVTSYFDEQHVAVIEIILGELRVGDTMRIAGVQCDFVQQVRSMDLAHRFGSGLIVSEDIHSAVDVHLIVLCKLRRVRARTTATRLAAEPQVRLALSGLRERLVEFLV